MDLLDEAPLLRHPHYPLVAAYIARHGPADDSPTLCFDDGYATIARHVETLPDLRTIVDIGCAWGVQQLFFEPYRYLGIDREQACGFGTDRRLRAIPFFRGPARATCLVASFPDAWRPEWNRPDSVFVASMSVGYRSPLPPPDVWLGCLGRMRGGYVRAHEEIQAAIRPLYGTATPLWEADDPDMAALVYYESPTGP